MWNDKIIHLSFNVYWVNVVKHKRTDLGKGNSNLSYNVNATDWGSTSKVIAPWRQEQESLSNEEKYFGNERLYLIFG